MRICRAMLFVVGPCVLAAGCQPGTRDAEAHVAIRALREEIGELRQQLGIVSGKAPDQAHAMTSVAYHFANLWFAGEADNWPLAQFYLNEVRSHAHWAVRVIPVRKNDAGAEIVLEPLLQSFVDKGVSPLQAAIDAKDADALRKAYQVTIANCHACHDVSSKPFIRLQIPTTPADPLIDFARADAGSSDE
jgi:hypothetical protein